MTVNVFPVSKGTVQLTGSGDFIIICSGDLTRVGSGGDLTMYSIGLASRSSVSRNQNTIISSKRKLEVVGSAICQKISNSCAQVLFTTGKLIIAAVPNFMIRCLQRNNCSYRIKLWYLLTFAERPSIGFTSPYLMEA